MADGTSESFESVPQDEEGVRRHLQRRLALFLLVIAIFLGGTLLVIQALTIVFFPRLVWSISLSPGRIVHLVAALAMLLAWLTCRKRTFSIPALHRMDVASTVACCLLLTLDLALNSARFMPDLILVILLGNTLTVRAALVPSTARRSFVIGMVAAVAAVVASYAIHARAGSPLPSPGAAVSLPIIFMAMAVAGTTLASRVIYGLRKQASSALRLGQYVLEQKIGEGGMGVVYRASHAMLKRPTAVKLVLPDKASPANIARFEREVRLTARLSHPNTIAIYDYGRTSDGVFYYAMEYLDGLTLDALVAGDGKQEPARVVHIVRQICAALAEAHGAGLIHRDIKPANVVLCERGGELDVVKVLDFGLVKRLQTGNETPLSHMNAVAGTPLYIAPEAITRPDRMDGRADLYSVGAVAYYLLTGSHVFSGSTPMELCMHHLQTAPTPPSERLGHPVDPRLEDLLTRCLAKDPADRPAGAGDMARELDQIGLVWTRESAHRWWSARGERRATSIATAPTDRAAPLATMTVALPRSAAAGTDQ